MSRWLFVFLQRVFVIFLPFLHPESSALVGNRSIDLSRLYSTVPDFHCITKLARALFLRWNLRFIFSYNVFFSSLHADRNLNGSWNKNVVSANNTHRLRCDDIMVIHFGAEKTSLLLALPTFSCAHIELERASNAHSPVAHKPHRLNEQSRKM